MIAMAVLSAPVPVRVWLVVISDECDRRRD